MLRRHPTTLLAFAAALLAQAQTAGAAPPNPAQVLFDRGVADMEAGRFEKACPAIQASQRLEPMPGTLFTLAECEAQRGRIATAMRYYAEYLALHRAFSPQKKAQQGDRKATSEEQLRKLELLAPRLTLKLPSNTASEVVVKRDGEIVADLSLGTPIAVDPGEHVITTQAPGGPEVAIRVSLAAGESKTVELSITREPEPPEAPAPSVGPIAFSSSAPAFAPPPPPDVRAWRIGTWSAGAIAVAGLTAGIVTGILAVDLRGVMNRNCHVDGSLTRCTPTGLEARSRLESLGNASTAGFVGGGIAAAVGVGLFVAMPSSPTPAGGVGVQPPNGAQLPPFGITMNGNF